MSAIIPTIEPATFAAGDSITWTKSLSDYPPSAGWSLLYSFRGNGMALDIPSTAVNANHQISLTAAQTATLLDQSQLPSGTPSVLFYNYLVSGYAVNGAQRVQIFSGRIKVTANLQAADAGFDPRTQERRTLDNINAVLEGRATSTILKSEVEGTRLERIPFADLLNLQAVYQVKVRNQEIELKQSQGQPTGKTLFASFTRPRFDDYTGQL